MEVRPGWEGWEGDFGVSPRHQSPPVPPRKICQHCKCPRGEHVGGGVPPTLQRVLARLLPESHPPPGSEDSGCSAEEFAWAPPGLSPDQVIPDSPSPPGAPQKPPK